MSKLTREQTKELEGKKFLDATKLALRDGDLDAAATRYELSTTRLFNFMRSGDHLDRFYQKHGEIALERLGKAGRKKGDLAVQLTEVIEAIGNEVLERLRDGQQVLVKTQTDAYLETIPVPGEEVEKLMKAAGLATDKLLLILGDPTVITATQGHLAVEVDESSIAGVLDKLAERAGVTRPEPQAIAAVRDDIGPDDVDAYFDE